MTSCSGNQQPLPPEFTLNGRGQLARPFRVLVAGDSLSESMGPQLKKALSGYTGLEIIPIGKRSTGLCRPDFFNWPEVLEKNLQELHPNIVFMWVGTNDNQNVYGMKGLGTPAFSPEWQQAYARKMLEIINLCTRYKAKLVFITPPVMPDGYFNNELEQINKLMFAVCKKYRVDCINGRSILADQNGKYQQSIVTPDGKTKPLRTPDTVHITDTGNQIVMERTILPRIYFYLYGKLPPNYKKYNGEGHRRTVPTAKHRGSAVIGGN